MLRIKNERGWCGGGMSNVHCPRLPTPDEKFPDLEDLSVGAFIKGTGALPTFGRESIIKSSFGKS